MFNQSLDSFNIPELQKILLEYKQLSHELVSCPVLKKLWVKYKIYKFKRHIVNYIKTAELYDLISGVVAIQLTNPMKYEDHSSLPYYSIIREDKSEYVIFNVDDITEQLTISAGPAHHILLNREIDAKVTYTVVLGPSYNKVSEFNINRYNDDFDFEHFGHPSTDPKLNTDRMLRNCILKFMQWVIEK